MSGCCLSPGSNKDLTWTTTRLVRFGWILPQGKVGIWARIPGPDPGPESGPGPGFLEKGSNCDRWLLSADLEPNSGVSKTWPLLGIQDAVQDDETRVRTP